MAPQSGALPSYSGSHTSVTWSSGHVAACVLGLWSRGPLSVSLLGVMDIVRDVVAEFDLSDQFSLRPAFLPEGVCESHCRLPFRWA